MPAISVGILVVVGEQGEGCNTACSRAGAECAPTALLSLNSCNVLRRHVACEAGCGVHPSLGGLPGYVVPTAEKPEQPAFCWTHAPIEQGGSDGVDQGCEASNPYIQRLCACSKRREGHANTTQ